MQLHANNRKLQGAACQAIASLARASLRHCKHVARHVSLTLTAFHLERSKSVCLTLTFLALCLHAVHCRHFLFCYRRRLLTQRAKVLQVVLPIQLPLLEK